MAACIIRFSSRIVPSMIASIYPCRCRTVFGSTSGRPRRSRQPLAQSDLFGTALT
jgi:hypothetical protein